MDNNGEQCKPLWIFSALQNYLKKPPWFSYSIFKPPWKKTKLKPPWLLHSKTKCTIPKTTISNLLVPGGLAHQKCYARVQPEHRVMGFMSVCWSKVRQHESKDDSREILWKHLGNSLLLFLHQNLSIWFVLILNWRNASKGRRWAFEKTFERWRHQYP